MADGQQPIQTSCETCLPRIHSHLLQRIFWLVMAVPPDCNSQYFVMGASKKRVGAQECPSGEPMLKIGSVDIIERGIQSEVGTHDLHRYNIIHRQSCGLHGSLNTIHDEFRFNSGVFRGPVGLGIDTNMAGNIERVTNKHSVTKW